MVRRGSRRSSNCQLPIVPARRLERRSRTRAKRLRMPSMPRGLSRRMCNSCCAWMQPHQLRFRRFRSPCHSSKSMPFQHHGDRRPFVSLRFGSVRKRDDACECCFCRDSGFRLERSRAAGSLSPTACLGRNWSGSNPCGVRFFVNGSLPIGDPKAMAWPAILPSIFGSYSGDEAASRSGFSKPTGLARTLPYLDSNSARG
jgi:hypothetical protein